MQRPAFVDQLVESYIADLVLFLMEMLGPKRAEIFKRTHLGIKPDKLAAQTLYNTPGGKKVTMKDSNDLLGDSRNVADRYATTTYDNGMQHGNTRLPPTMNDNLMAGGTAVSEEYQTLQLPALDTRSFDGNLTAKSQAEKKSSHRKSKNQNSGSKSVEPRGQM